MCTKSARTATVACVELSFQSAQTLHLVTSILSVNELMIQKIASTGIINCIMFGIVNHGIWMLLKQSVNILMVVVTTCHDVALNQGVVTPKSNLSHFENGILVHAGKTERFHH